MALYELVFLVRQDVSQSQVQNLSEQIKTVIEGLGGRVPKTEYCGLRNLAYRIKKNRKAHYMLLNIDAPSAAVDEAERQMGLNEDVLRHLRIAVESLDPEPSALAQSRFHRERSEDGESMPAPASETVNVVSA